MITNTDTNPLALYVVHVDDIGKSVTTVRAVATLILMPGESCDSEQFRAYLNATGCAFPAALVRKDGSVILSDPRHFSTRY